MSSLVRQTRQLERVIRRKEKIFLMEQYAAAMLQQLEPTAGEDQADEQVMDALRIAYRYVNPELATRLSALLLAYGYAGDLEAEREDAEAAEAATFAEEEEEEEEEEAPQPKAKKGRAAGPPADPDAEAEEDEEAGALFERDIYTGRKSGKKDKKVAAQDGEEGAADLFADDDETAEGDAADLFAEDEDDAEGDSPAKAPRGKKGKPKKGAAQDGEEDVADLFASDDETAEGDAADLFAEDEDDAEGDSPAKAPRGKKGKPKKGAAQDGEEDVADLFADDGDEAEDNSTAKTARGKKDKPKKTAAQDQEEDNADLLTGDDETAQGDAADLFADGQNEDTGALFEQDIYTAGKKKKKKRRGDGEAEEEPGDLADDATEEDKPRRFKPTRGHVRKETPGFAAPESAVERDEKSRRGYDLYAPEPETEDEPEAKPKARKRPGPAVEEEEEEGQQAPTRRGRREGPPESEEEEEDRPERPAKPKREARPVAAEEEKEEKGRKQGKEAQADPKAEEKKLNLDALTYQVSIEDLRAKMGITLVREDHVKLMRRWDQKSRDNSIRLLLDDPKATQHPYALIPRINRFVKDGQVVQVNMYNLVRHFFQLFENVPQVVQLKTEPFFLTETPTLEWAIVACEALPDTLNKTVLEQKTIFSHYIQKFMGNERRVRRRVLVEALYDVIVLNLVTKEPILRKTVDLTETRRGRQQQMCINFGAKGIRVSSITRDQRHPQMGMCPSW